MGGLTDNYLQKRYGWQESNLLQGLEFFQAVRCPTNSLANNLANHTHPHNRTIKVKAGGGSNPIFRTLANNCQLAILDLQIVHVQALYLQNVELNCLTYQDVMSLVHLDNFTFAQRIKSIKINVKQATLH